MTDVTDTVSMLLTMIIRQQEQVIRGRAATQPEEPGGVDQKGFNEAVICHNTAIGAMLTAASGEYKVTV